MKYSEHIQWIIDNRNEALTKALSQDSSYKTIDNPFGVFLSADPTPKKKLTQWLVDTYIYDGFRWEDIQSGSKSKVFDTLCLYIKNKSKLGSNRDLQVNANKDYKIINNSIGQYNSLGSVYKDIAPFIKSDKSSRSVKRDEQALAYEESEILVKSNALTVVIPKTEYASKWWGKGTQWCTAGDKNNMFESYYKDGPLMIIIINGVKTQLHIDLVHNNNAYFMDEHDNKVRVGFIKENWSLLSPIIEWAVKQNGLSLNYIPRRLRVIELCLEAVRQNGLALEYVPEPLRTAELCLEAVRQSGMALKYVPDSLKTEELCINAMKKNSDALTHIPKYLRTPNIYLEAVKQNGFSLVHIDNIKITEEICIEAVKNDGNVLWYIPEHLRTEQICLEAVKQNGRTLNHVPKELRTEELCLEAVKQDSTSIYYVPKELRTAELCLEAVRQNGLSLRYVPEYLRTPELCREALKQNGCNLRYIAEQYKKQSSLSSLITNKPTWNLKVIENLKIEMENYNNLKIEKMAYLK